MLIDKIKEKSCANCKHCKIKKTDKGVILYCEVSGYEFPMSGYEASTTCCDDWEYEGDLPF
jgi:hypothetical protein